MIIAIYGIPRSGKDTFINKIIKNRKSSYHLKGSQKLNELSNLEFKKPFKNLNNNEQKQIRIEFTKFAKELEKDFDLLIVDGHYAFPSEEGFTSVFTEEDLKLYDAFFYLKRTPEEIKRNFNSGDKFAYSEYLLDDEKVLEWMAFELTEMQSKIENEKKDFIVLDSNEISVEYIVNFHKTSLEVANEIANEIRQMSTNKRIILSDLDKTISINDLTNDYIEYATLDSHMPKTIFKGDYYSAYQFYEFHTWLCDASKYRDAIEYSLSKIIINECLVNNIKNIRKDSITIALTTGMADAWNLKNNEINLFDKIYGFGKTKKTIITPLIKKMIAEILSKTNEVITIGDSIIDLGMLSSANKGFLVSMLKLDKRIQRAYEQGFDFSKIFQPSYSVYKYDFIKEGDVKW